MNKTLTLAIATVLANKFATEGKTMTTTPNPQAAAKVALDTIDTACPNAAHMGEHACSNRAQCWEPCGDLGKSKNNARRVAIDPEARDAD